MPWPDALSRHQRQNTRQRSSAKHELITGMAAAVNRERVRTETVQDPQMSSLVKVISKGFPVPREPKTVTRDPYRLLAGLRGSRWSGVVQEQNSHTKDVEERGAI